ncbi:hypothetical protein [Arcanobacterium phocae]|uniref:hypothetical protein n=1 Tax=Arcanobacterium phocae TaxID=131112 RepID=UPI000B84C020|nr:hypothetical protein [Arcanobacterium phocae]
MKHQKLCLTVCGDVTGEYKISIVMSTHNNFAASYADHVHLFLDGEPTGMVVNPSLESLAFAQETSNRPE